MKKLLSILLALLMLALPVFSGAEEAVVSEPDFSSFPSMGGFVQKYQAEGQEATNTVTFVPGDLLLALVGEDYSPAVTDLLNVLAVQTKVQASGGKAQGSFSLQLSGEDALQLTAAATQEGLFASSNLLGEGIYMLNGEDLKVLAKQLSDYAVDQGIITREQLDSLVSQFNSFSADPSAAITSLFGEPDLSGVMDALSPIMASVTTEAVTEAPAMLPDASTVVTVPLKKAELTKLAEELAKLIWSLPVVQQLAPAFASESGTALTEESLTAGLKKIPEALAEDTALLIYTNEAGNSIYITAAAALTASGANAEANLDCLIAVSESDVSVVWTAGMLQGEEGILSSGQMAMNPEHMDYTMTMDMAKADGSTWRPMEVIVDADFTVQEGSIAYGMNWIERIQPEADADVVAVTVKAAGVESDLGDHAESQHSVTYGLENQGDLLTVNVSGVTGLAEAYIDDSANAIRPMAMSQEELSALGNQVAGNAQVALITAMQKLPESVLQLVNALMGQTAQ